MSKARYTFALAGNQNSGKTTLFNVLTGSNQHVGNWPGVTVEQKTGVLIHHHHGGDAHFGLPALGGKKRMQDEENSDVEIVDLPGIYSLSPYSMEEIVSRNFITLEKPDVVINIVDATNLERNLYLTLQLLQLGTPMVIALNMMDEVRAHGDVIHLDILQRELHVPVVAICARKGEGIDELVRLSMDAAEHHRTTPPLDICGGPAHKALHAMAHLMEARATAAGLTPRYAATKLLEGDEPMAELLKLSEDEKHIIEEIVSEMEEAAGMERAAVMADVRYNYIERLLDKAVVRRNPDGDQLSVSDRVDRVLTHPVLAIPLFIFAMLMVFYITFGPIGSWVSDGFEGLVNAGIAAIGAWLSGAGVAQWLQALVVDGVLTGVGSVLSFMPSIVILFMCLSILEDSGYMARAAFLMDKPLRKIGLNGRSFIPMIMGFGCTVPAVMSARSMSSRRDRRFTILLTPFMSCGAKVPVYALFARAFFDDNLVMVMSCLYLGGILVAVIAGLILKRVLFHGDAAPFIMELPAYRLPTPRNVLRTMWDKAKDFIQRAFTVIFLATVIVWFLQSFTFRFEAAQTIQESMLGTIAGLIAPIFRPLGFGTVEASTAVLTGIMAKESVVSTLAVLTGVDIESGAMLSALHGIFPSTSAAMAFLTIVLLYMPCVAAFAAMKRELESRRWAIAAVAGQTAVAWVCALIVYTLACFAGV